MQCLSAHLRVGRPRFAVELLSCSYRRGLRHGDESPKESRVIGSLFSEALDSVSSTGSPASTSCQYSSSVEGVEAHAVVDDMPVTLEELTNLVGQDDKPCKSTKLASLSIVRGQP